MAMLENLTRACRTTWKSPYSEHSSAWYLKPNSRLFLKFSFPRLKNEQLLLRWVSTWYKCETRQFVVLYHSTLVSCVFFDPGFTNTGIKNFYRCTAVQNSSIYLQLLLRCLPLLWSCPLQYFLSATKHSQPSELYDTGTYCHEGKKGMVIVGLLLKCS